MNNKQNKKAPQMGKKNKKTKGLVSAPLAQYRPMKTNMPSISGSAYSSDGRIRVQHREYIGDVLGSVNFASTAYAVNPGLAQTFTWLAPIANQFESYLLRSLSFEFETQKSASTSGSIMLAMDYDASDPAPINKQQLMSYHDSVRSAVWGECCFTADARDLQKFGVQRYVRSGALAANLDIKTFDVGNLFIATQGCADATAIGELYVKYDVELITPQSDQTGEALGESVKVSGGGVISRTAMFGTAPVLLGGLPCTATGKVLTFNRVGNYLVEINLVGTVFTGVPANAGTCTATSLVGVFNAAATSLLCSYIVKVNNVGETLDLDWTAVATTVTASITRVGSYAYSNA